MFDFLKKYGRILKIILQTTTHAAFFMMRKSDYGTDFSGHVFIFLHIVLLCAFLFAKKENFYAEKPISENDFCTYHSFDNRSRLCVPL